MLVLLYALCINAPEGCQLGTHTNETAYPLGPYASAHTQIHAQPDKATRYVLHPAGDVAKSFFNPSLGTRCVSLFYQTVCLSTRQQRACVRCE